MRETFPSLPPGTLASLLHGDLADATTRLVLADALWDARREDESLLARDLGQPVAALGDTLVRLYTIRHVGDPEARGWSLWPYVYLDGLAETWCAIQARWGQPEVLAWRGDDDLVVSDLPRPPFGRHRATLYGRTVVVFIHPYADGVGGRAVFPEDRPSYADASDPARWR
jgi:hypothetical protein